MSEPEGDLRVVRLHKTADGGYEATNVRGGTLSVGTGNDADFTPSELLLAALAACTSIDLDLITRKRAEAVSLRAESTARKVRDASGNRLTDLQLGFDLRFPEGERGDAAREMLPRALAMSRDRLCTVGRTVAAGEQPAYRLLGSAD